jgi:hypothetical protein
MKPIVKVVVLALVAGLFVLAAKAYLGYRNFYSYAAGREEATNLEGSFGALEPKLQRAVSFSHNPLFYQEMGRLYLEMALAENKFGTPEKRDEYLDRAWESLEGLIRRNPLEAFGYFELGKVYMLYNYPLLTYAAKGRVYLRTALEMRPVDEDLNVNVTYVYLAQWDRLSDAEKDFVYAAVARNLETDTNFFPRVLALWTSEFKDSARLKAIFSDNQDLWAKLARYFPVL